MENLQLSLKEKLSKNFGYKPTVFNLQNKTDSTKIADLLVKNQIQYVSDDYEKQLEELFAVQNPTLVYGPNFKDLFREYLGNVQKSTTLFQQGSWVYYSWHSSLVHVLPEKDFVLVRTARNQNLINKEEQEKFYNATVGIGGLSVGSSVAYALALQGGPKHFKLADMDHLALTNTNRVLSSVENLGVLKVEMAARHIYEINPYAEVEVFPEGLTKENIKSFFKGLNIVVDELDNLAVKYLIREEAKKSRIAVVMGADNGDNAVVDVERYDLDQNTPFFQGRLPGETYDSLSRLDKFGIGKTITKHIGPENITERMQQSLLEMGKTIVSWPQLGGAAMLNGAAVAYCIRKILNKQPVESNRAIILLDEKLIPNYNSPQEQEKRKNIAQSFRQMFGLS